MCQTIGVAVEFAILVNKVRWQGMLEFRKLTTCEFLLHDVTVADAFGLLRGRLPFSHRNRPRELGNACFDAQHLRSQRRTMFCGQRQHRCL